MTTRIGPPGPSFGGGGGGAAVVKDQVTSVSQLVARQIGDAAVARP